VSVSVSVRVGVVGGGVDVLCASVRACMCVCCHIILSYETSPVLEVKLTHSRVLPQKSVPLCHTPHRCSSSHLNTCVRVAIQPSSPHTTQGVHRNLCFFAIHHTGACRHA